MPTQHNHSDLNNDLQFLVDCCQSHLSKDTQKSILSYLETTHVNNDAIIRLAHQHGILPLVYKTIKSLPISDMLQPSLAKLKIEYMHIAQSNMLMSAELIRIMKLLEDNGIEALAFKGPTLSQMAYGDITLRQFGDLDILVTEKDIYKTAEIILSQNYEPMDSIEFLRNPAKLHVEKNYEFYGKKNGIKVEIHWRLISSSFLKRFKNYDVFSTHGTVLINNTSLPTLDTKILLLYLCNHGASHMWERLEWIADINRLIRSKETSWDWDEVLALAETLQSKTSLLLGLALSKKLFNTTLPPNVQSQCHSVRISKLVAFILDTLNSDFISKDHTSHKKNLTVFQFHLALQDSFSTKMSFILVTIFGYSDGDVMMVNLPRSLFFLYYPLRIVRIINKYTLNPMKKLFIK